MPNNLDQVLCMSLSPPVHPQISSRLLAHVQNGAIDVQKCGLICIVQHNICPETIFSASYNHERCL